VAPSRRISIARSTQAAPALSRPARAPMYQTSTPPGAVSASESRGASTAAGFAAGFGSAHAIAARPSAHAR
jgi:hypothetical protein